MIYKEKKMEETEERMIVAAQQYALKHCQTDLSKLTIVKLAWEDGFKTAQQEKHSYLSVADLKAVIDYIDQLQSPSASYCIIRTNCRNELRNRIMKLEKQL